MTPQQIIDAWNAQADEANQWGALGEDEKLMWAYKQAIAEAALARQDVQDEIDRGAKTLRETYLAQPEQEPVVWMYQDKSTHEVRFQKHMRDFVDHGATYETPLYTAPPQRTWVGLTEDDLRQIILVAVGVAEAKLKEKNT